MADAVVPYVAADRDIPELTIKAVILGIILAVILGAANAYLGLRVGQTVSASIPAAVVSMAVLRLFRRRTILENNGVQTAASAGEALAAGVIFTIPALLILGEWTQIHYWETTLIALVGGIIGVFFTVPLRRAFIVDAQLNFPEGIATSEVLKAGEGGRAAGIVALGVGALAGGLYKFMQSGLNLWTGEALYGGRTGSTLFAFGGTLSPALLGVGYIVGLQVASLVFLGGIIGWLVGIPLYAATAAGMELTAGMGAVDASYTIWSTQIRYMGVGAMLVGGLWSLGKLRKPLIGAFQGMRADAKGGTRARTDRDLSLRTTYVGISVLSLPLFALYWFFTGDLGVALALGVLMLLLGFLFSAVAAYMAGLVGSSQNPISGVTIITVLASAGLLYLLGVDVEVGPAAAILVAGVIASAAAIGGDNMQDLKCGYLLGSTPRRQQIMQLVGVTAAALTIALVVRVLTTAYELGSPDLAAPQAGLMAAVAGGIFGVVDLPYNMIWIGIGIAVLLIVADEILQARGSKLRTPVMPVAVGIYLPVGLSLPIFLGGLVAWGTARAMRGREASHDGTLLASGLIAGEALLGIVIAALAAIEVEREQAVLSALYLLDGTWRWPGVVLLSYIALVLGYVAVRRRVVERGTP